MNVVTREMPVRWGNFFGAGLVALCIFLVLIPVATLPDLATRLVLASVFIVTGILLRRNEYLSYLLFLAIYPLIPSHLNQIRMPEFSASEFLFLCFAFWWSIYKMIDRKPLFAATSVRVLLLFQFTYLCLSTFLALYTITSLLSRVFLLQMKDHWDLLLPMGPLDIWAPLRAWLTQSEGLLFFFITLDVLNSEIKIRRAAETIFYSAVIVSILGLLQYVFHFRLLPFWLKENRNLIRINSTMDDPNSLGTYLAAALCLGVFMQSISESRVLNVKLLFPIVIIVAIWATGSRSSLGALLIFFVILPLVFKRAGYVFVSQRSPARLWMMKIAAVVMVLLLISVVTATWVNTEIDKPANWVEFLLTSLNISQPSSTVLKGRMDLWQTAIRMWRKSPVLGTGLGSFLYRVSSRPYDYPELRVPHNAHNYFLQVLAETGVLGLFLFLLIPFVVLKPAIRKLLTQKSGDENLGLYAFLSAIFVFLISSITGHPLLLPKLQYLFWALLAFLYLQAADQQQAAAAGVRKLVVALALVLLLTLPLYLWWAQRVRSLSVMEAGYYGWEKDVTGRIFHWTKEEAVSDLPRQGDSVSFGIRQINEPLQKMPSRVDLFFNGRLRDHITLTDSQWKDQKYNLDTVSNHHRLVIDIKPEKTFSPVDFGIPDGRRLGIQITPFQWGCASNLPQPWAFAFFRTADQTLRLSTVAIEHPENAADLQMSDATGETINLRSDLWPNEFQTPKSVPLFAPYSPDSVYRVDGTHNMEIRKTLAGKLILFRLQARPLLQARTLPILFVRSNGKQVLKIPIPDLAWNTFYFELPGTIKEMSFSNWDGLSETNKSTDAPIQIRELRAWPDQNSTHPLTKPGWFETSGSSESILDANAHSHSPKALVQAGDSISIEKNWTPGIASLVITAKAQLAGSEPPVLGVYVANRNVESIKVTTEQTQDYRIDLPLAGDQQIKIIFENDYSDPAKGEDRNVILYGVRLEHHPSFVIAERLEDPLLPTQPCFTLTQKAQ